MNFRHSFPEISGLFKVKTIETADGAQDRDSLVVTTGVSIFIGAGSPVSRCEIGYAKDRCLRLSMCLCVL